MTPRRTAVRTALLALALLVCPACPERTPKPAVPKPGAFNAHVMAIAESYPTDGTHRYHWPKTGSWIGTTRRLEYAGELLAEGDPKGRCHCSGITFEVFLRAWERWCEAEERPYRILDYDLAEVKRLRRAWFGTSGDRATLHTALTKNELGLRITDWEKAQKGDFLQLWRHSGSGHSAIFLAWDRNEEGAIRGVKYWSSQSSTDGIGENTERFGTEGSAVKRDEFYLVRVGRP